VVGDPGAAAGLARGRLALAGREHAAEEDLIHVLAVDAGPLEGGADGDAAELMRGERGERALERADGGASSAGDHDFPGHLETPLLCERRASRRNSLRHAAAGLARSLSTRRRKI